MILTLEELKFPIGKFQVPEKITQTNLTEWISVIKNFPSKLKSEVIHLSEEQLNTSYRTGGWTIRQVIHHCADSHMNTLIRFKLALTEDCPIVKPYFENRWAELADTKNAPIVSSINLLEGVHERLTLLLQGFTEKEFARTFMHPEYNKVFRLDEILGFYAWHCNHHLAHIISLKFRKAWK